MAMTHRQRLQAGKGNCSRTAPGLEDHPRTCKSLTWPVANLFSLLGITYVIGKMKFKLLCMGIGGWAESGVG